MDITNESAFCIGGNYLKVVIAPDSFKGSLTAMEAATAIAQGVQHAFPLAETSLIPMADGGEGTLETLVDATGGFTKQVQVKGPLGDKVEATYGILGDNKTCIIEMASASGIVLVPEGKLNPLTTTTFGTGELIRHGLDEGYRTFILAIGGSATNDGGAGMLQALGLRLLDDKGQPVGFGGGRLRDIHRIDVKGFDERIKESSFLIAFRCGKSTHWSEWGIARIWSSKRCESGGRGVLRQPVDTLGRYSREHNRDSDS